MRRTPRCCAGTCGGARSRPSWRSSRPTEIALEACGGVASLGAAADGDGPPGAADPAAIRQALRQAQQERSQPMRRRSAKPQGARPCGSCRSRAPSGRASSSCCARASCWSASARRLVNALRGHATEFGLVVPLGYRAVEELLDELAADPEVPDVAREMLALLGRQIEQIDQQLAVIDARLLAMHKANRGEPAAGPGARRRADHRDQPHTERRPGAVRERAAISPPGSG